VQFRPKKMGSLSHQDWSALTMRNFFDQRKVSLMKRENAMKHCRATVAFAALLSCLVFMSVPVFADSIIITVPGTSDMWLAGMPTGSGASGFASGTPVVDFAGPQSPVRVGLPIAPGEIVMFTNVTGAVRHGPEKAFQGPDGDLDPNLGLRHHFQGAQNGISDITVPQNSLLGMFLGTDRPDLNSPPPALDFSTRESQDYLALAPLLQQVFYIGDGLTSGADPLQQQIIVPTGATSLYLGTMDGWEWNNNGGSFTLTMETNPDPVPEPGSFILLGTGLGGLAFAYWRRGQRASNHA
jgi:hypothetical protein